MGSLGLRGRVGIILILQAVAMFAFVAGFMATAEQWKGEPVYRLPMPAQVAAVAAAFEQAPPSAHDELMRALNDSTQVVVLLPALPDADHSVATEQTAERYRAVLEGRPFRILADDGRVPEDYGKMPLFSTGRLQVAAALADGRSVAVSQMATPPVAQVVNRSLLFVAMIVAVNLMFAVLIAAQTRGPVDRLLRAVREDRHQAFVVSGPREIVALGLAFQDLRARLHALMDERTRMLAAIAHDFRTYLTRMELRGDFIADERQRALASQDIGEMNSLIDDTLLYAQGVTDHEGEHPTCDVVDLLHRLVGDREAVGQRLRLHGADGVIEARISAVSLSRILANLLDNALSYGGGAATITVAADEEVVMVQVDDDGPGVPETALAQLTEPFHRLETSRSRGTGGVGLGLSIVQALASRHEGWLTLSNRPEGGLRAQLHLRPASPRHAIASRNNGTEPA